MQVTKASRYYLEDLNQKELTFIVTALQRYRTHVAQWSTDTDNSDVRATHTQNLKEIDVLLNSIGQAL